MHHHTRMNGAFAKVLFALAVLANLLISQPLRALAQPQAAIHTLAEHAGSGLHHHGAIAEAQYSPDHHPAAAQPASHDSGDCSCQTGLCCPMLTSPGAMQGPAWTVRPGHGRPGSSQISDSDTLPPPLRPPRA